MEVLAILGLVACRMFCKCRPFRSTDKSHGKSEHVIEREPFLSTSNASRKNARGRARDGSPVSIMAQDV